MAAHVNFGFDEHLHGDTPFDMGSENDVGFGQNGGVDQKLVVAVCQEMIKIFKGKGIMEEKNYAGTSHAVENLIQTNNLTAHFYANDFLFQDPSTKEIVAVERYGQSNRPMIYQLERELSQMQELVDSSNLRSAKSTLKDRDLTSRTVLFVTCLTGLRKRNDDDAHACWCSFGLKFRVFISSRGLMLLGVSL
nr:hypothetical protein [Tanacetum cinerariifolium]